MTVKFDTDPEQIMHKKWPKSTHSVIKICEMVTMFYGVIMHDYQLLSCAHVQ